MLQAPKQLLAAGDRAPNFVLPDNEGKFRMFYDRVSGRPLVLLFCGAIQPPILPAPLVAFQAEASRLDAEEVDVFCITPSDSGPAQAMLPNLQIWSDREGKITEAYLSQTGLGGRAALKDGNVVGILMDPNQRVLTVISGKTGDLAAKVLDYHAKRSVPPAQVRRSNAPVIVMPNLLDPEMCAALIESFDKGEVKEGVVASVLEGKELERVHHERKKRLDHRIDDMALHRILQNTIGRRIAPELSKAFNFEGFQFDRFLVCRYAADREDRFRTHRDNVSPATADRRFAMTLNLNGDEYEGGELVFPEYGRDGYKPGNGGAVVFSCSLLHEALPVTKGARYALLTFLRAPSGSGAAGRG